VVPVSGPAKVTAALGNPLQMVWGIGLTTVGVGLTVMVKDVGFPMQELAVGVMVMVAVTGEVLALVTEKEGRLLPLPEAARPIPGLLFDQE